MAIVVQKSFDFIENSKGELMLVVMAGPRAPKQPRVLYDGESIATLNRGRGQNVFKLSPIPPSVHPRLMKAQSMLVCEMASDGEMLHIYDAPVKLVEL